MYLLISTFCKWRRFWRRNSDPGMTVPTFVAISYKVRRRSQFWRGIGTPLPRTWPQSPFTSEYNSNDRLCASERPFQSTLNWAIERKKVSILSSPTHNWESMPGGVNRAPIFGSTNTTATSHVEEARIERSSSVAHSE